MSISMSNMNVMVQIEERVTSVEGSLALLAEVITMHHDPHNNELHVMIEDTEIAINAIEGMIEEVKRSEDFYGTTTAIDDGVDSDTDDDEWVEVSNVENPLASVKEVRKPFPTDLLKLLEERLRSLKSRVQMMKEELLMKNPTPSSCEIEADHHSNVNPSSSSITETVIPPVVESSPLPINTTDVQESTKSTQSSASDSTAPSEHGDPQAPSESSENPAPTHHVDPLMIAAIAGCGVVGGLGLVLATPLILTSIGFATTGIVAESVAAGMMSSAAIANGGGVAAGSLVATLQSIGAAGLGATGATVVGGTGAAVGSAGGALVAFVSGLFQKKSKKSDAHQNCDGDSTEGNEDVLMKSDDSGDSSSESGDGVQAGAIRSESSDSMGCRSVEEEDNVEAKCNWSEVISGIRTEEHQVLLPENPPPLTP